MLRAVAIAVRLRITEVVVADMSKVWVLFYSSERQFARLFGRAL